MKQEIFPEQQKYCFISTSSLESNQTVGAGIEYRSFQRNGRKEMLPTKQADLLYERTLVLLEEWEETQQKLLNEQNEEEVCRIVASHTFAVYLLPQLMKHLIKRFPKVHFEIEITNSHESLEQVAKHESDFGFIEKPLETSGVQRYSLMEDQLVIAGDPKANCGL